MFDLNNHFLDGQPYIRMYQGAHKRLRWWERLWQWLTEDYYARFDLDASGSIRYF